MYDYHCAANIDYYGLGVRSGKAFILGGGKTMQAIVGICGIAAVGLLIYYVYILMKGDEQ